MKKDSIKIALIVVDLQANFTKFKNGSLAVANKGIIKALLSLILFYISLGNN